MSKTVALPSWLTIIGEVTHNEEKYLEASAKGDGYDLYCTTAIPSGETVKSMLETPQRYLVPMLNNLGGAIFDHKYPGKFIPLVRAQAVAMAHRQELAPEWAALQAELEKYTYRVD